RHPFRGNWCQTPIYEEEPGGLMNIRIARALRVPAFVMLAALAVAAAALETTRPEAVGVSSERLERLTQTLEDYVESGRLAGGVALVARRGQIVYLHVFGERDRESGAPMAADSMVRIAPQAKANGRTAVKMPQEERPR